MLAMTYIGVYKLIFLVALLSAEVMFLVGMPRQLHFLRRIWLCLAFIAAAALFYPTNDMTAMSSSLMFVFFFLLTIPAARCCFDMDWPSCCFCSIAAYSVQHIASILYNVVMNITGLDHAASMYSNASAQFSPLSMLIMLNVYGLCYFVMYHFFACRLLKRGEPVINNPAILALIALVVLVEILLNAFVVYHLNENRDMVYYLCASLTNLLCSITVLVIMFGQLLNKSLEEQLDVVNRLRMQEKRKYDISKETIDMINIKCHDMRHQIHTIRHAKAIDPQALKEVEQSIRIYDTLVKTGSEALDVIMMEKAFFCQNHGITINCIVDGAKLGFMTDMDIYSLFGNLLDNAINSVLDLDPDKRVVGVTVKSRGQLLSVNSHNYYEGEVYVQRGLPVTDKKDKTLHGFGTKSMKMIVDRYGGTIDFNAENHVFNVNILLPLMQEAAEEKQV